MKYLEKLTQQPYPFIYLFVYSHSLVALIWTELNTKSFHVNFFDDDVIGSIWGLGALIGALILSGVFALIRQKKIALLVILLSLVGMIGLISHAYIYPSSGMNINLI